MVEVTRLARPLGVLVPVSFTPRLWAFCETGAAEAGLRLDADRVARYMLAGLVRALRRAGGAPPATLPFRVVLGQLELSLVARLGPGGIAIEDGPAVALRSVG